MTSQRYDVIVLGVGGMGSATVDHLARRGKRVLGLERYNIPHEMGSSHGVTRIIRLAYHEHPSYVTLLRRAYELWRDLEQDAGERLMHITGSIEAGPPEGIIFKGAYDSCLVHDLPHEVLTSRELTHRYPAFNLPMETSVLFQPDGGFLLSERCIVAHVTRALAHGAEIHGREGVLDWQPTHDGVRVRTERATYEAERLVITAGAWASQLIAHLAGLALPERQMILWLQPRRPEIYTPERLPVFIAQVEEGLYYGLPIYQVPGLKLGLHHHLRQRADPDTLDRNAISAQDEEIVRTFAERYLNGANGPTLSMKTCLYTNSPDEHFILDLHPEYPQVAIAAGFSGHGFKFCSVVGEIMADFVEQGATRHDTALFRLSRLPLKAG